MFHKTLCPAILMLGAALPVVSLASAADAETGGQRSRAPANGEVLPLGLPPETDGRLQAVRRRIYRAAQRQGRYLLGTVHPWKEDPSLLLLTESRSTEHWIRPNTGAIQGFSFLYRFGPYEEKVVGVSRPALLNDTILPMMRYVIATHVTGTRSTSDGKPWGDAWQSAHWAHMLGRAGWWIWDDLPEEVRRGIRRVAAHEADRIARGTPPSRIKHDTKSEENAWNSQILSVAVLLMPGDRRREAWETAFQRWVLSSYLRPADEDSEAIVDGRTVREQFTGANIHDDFTLENHGIVHPDYMTCFGLSLGCGLDYAMSGRQPPEALLFNVAGIYENLKWFVLPDGGFVYPSGQDWRLFRNADWIHAHLLMAVFGRDPDAWSLALRSLDTLEKMQARSDSGAVYQEGEYFFASTQPDLFRSLSQQWLLLRVAGDVPDEARDRAGVRRLDSGKIILNRTPTAVHTFSWGNKVMAQCVPCRPDRIVSPHQRNGIGYVRVKGTGQALPVTVREARVSNDARQFAAELVLDHGTGQIRAHLDYRSSADGSWTMREKLVALDEVTTTEIATGLVGILNNPIWVYEQGERHVAIDGRESVVPSSSGKTLENGAAREIVVDSTLQISSEEPLSVRYVGAAGPQRARVTDELSLNSIRGERTWHAGDVISQFEVTVRCRGRDPAKRGAAARCTARRGRRG